MGYSNRDWYRDGDGNDSSSPRSPLTYSESPLDRSYGVGTLAGIRVELHLMFLIWISVQFLFLLSDGVGLALSLAVVSVFGLSIFFHELGHSFGCRWVGGRSNRIVMLPFGGVALCQSPNRPWPTFFTAAAGPAVTLLLSVAALGVLALRHGEDFDLQFSANPFRLVQPVLGSSDGLVDPTLVWAYRLNYYLFLLNALVPMLPLDGGQMLAAALWPRMGHGPAMYQAATVGMFAAAVLGIFGLVSGAFMLVCLAILGYLTCLQTRYQSAGHTPADAPPSDLSWDPSPSRDDDEPRVFGRIGPSRASTSSTASSSSRAGSSSGSDTAHEWAERLRQEREAARREDELVDEILGKISRTGMASLTAAERETLRAASERKKRQSS